MPRPFRLPLLACLLSASLSAQTLGDLTSHLQWVVSPIWENSDSASAYTNYNAQVSGQYHTLRHFPANGRLYLSCGDTNNLAPKRALYLDPATALVGHDNPDALWPEEALDELHLLPDGRLLATSYDGFADHNGNNLYVNEGTGWTSIRTAMGDHIRDATFFNNRWFVGNALTNQNARFPGIFSAPAAAPDLAFTRVEQTPPPGFDARFIPERFFTFDGALYAAQVVNNLSGSWDRVFLLRHDPANASAPWQPAHLTPLTFYPEGTVNQFGPTPLDPVEVATAAGPRLLFIANPGTPHLWAATGIADGTRFVIENIPGLDPANDRPLRLLSRDGHLHLLTATRPPFADASRVALASPGDAAWTITRPGMNSLHRSTGASFSPAAPGPGASVLLPVGQTGLFATERTPLPRVTLALDAQANEARLGVEDLDASQRYHWQTSTDLTNWTDFGALIEGRAASLQTAPPSGPRCFFRVVLEP